MKLTNLVYLGVFGLTVSAVSGQAQVFNYTDGDLILAFSESGYPDVEVDIGNVASLASAAKAAGGKVEITAYNINSQLLGNFGSTAGLSFAVFGQQFNQAGSVSAGTVYLSQKQGGANPITPPTDRSALNQSLLGGKILAIEGLDANGNITTKGLLPWSADNAADSVVNTPTVVIITTSGLLKTFSYSYIAGGSFTGAPTNPKNTTPAVFTSGSIISDLFEFDPTGNVTQPSVYLGYFTFNSDGSLYFSVPAAAHTTITGITVAGKNVSVTFNTVSGVKYALYYSTNLTTSLSNWVSVPGSVSGTGTPASLTDTTATNAARFYAIGASLP
jgi:hypothetical protein